MKILFYIDSLGGGGAERVMVNLVNRFAADGNDVILVNSTKRSNVTDYKLSPIVRHLFLLDSRKKNIFLRNISLIFRLRKTINKYNPDIAVSFMGEPNIRLLLTFTNKVRKVVSIRTDPNIEYSSSPRKWLLRHLFPMADLIVMQTKDAVDRLPKHLHPKCKIIFNQVNPKFYSIIHNSDDYYLAVGRLVPSKNYSLMINAFAEFSRNHPNAKLNIYGEGPLFDELNKQINHLNAESNIKLMGRSNDIPNVLSNAKCLIMTSNYEGMPNALLEACAAGVPCISTDCPVGGPKLIISDKKSGLLIPVGDKDALVDALTYVECNSDKVKVMGEKAKEIAKRDFDPEVVYQQWKDSLLSLL